MASSVYKNGQGYYTRMGTSIGAGLVALLGLWWLWGLAGRVRVGSINPTYVSAGTSILVGAVVALVIYHYVFRSPRTGDFLIATEGEMKKVNWSTRREIVGSTTVVIFLMFLITSFVFAVDRLFVIIFTAIRVLDVPS
jgi:preprotein translocase SecE subunit